MAGNVNPSTLRVAMPVALLLFLLLLLLGLHPFTPVVADITMPTYSAVGLDRQWIADTVEAYKQQKSKVDPIIGSSNIVQSLSKAEANRTIISVRQDGSGDFKTITSALDSIPIGNSWRTIVKIGPGVYREKLTVDRHKPYITFYGDPHEMPTISYYGTAAEYGTLKSATVAVESDYFVAANIIFQNAAPKPPIGSTTGQAVALRVSGDRAAFYNCKFNSYQDTLCDDIGMHYFRNCHIKGTVDFIFGNGRSIYENCTIQSVADGITAITAHARRKTSDSGGFSFIHCNVTGTGKAYLSRAWMESSRVVFSYSYLDSLVNPEGWDDKGYKDRDRTLFFAEYRCTGPGAATDKRVSYGKVLTDEQAKPFLSNTFIRADEWLLPPALV